MKSVFNRADVDEMISRINTLTPDTKALWGKMSVDQMLAHLCVSYEMVYENKHPKPNPVMRLILKMFVKNGVVGSKPYKQNLPTAPAFRITDSKNFEAEKQRLIAYMNRVQQDGIAYFDGKESLSFGALTKDEWNTLFYKHFDHHLSQFGA
ncbi:MAG: DUF1569 domain-containing protein [Candidatus Kapabacteria bacterium]|nr:DUF1569 domain-containing protein [Candidatus Kapabacteria bacterium]MBX7154017.1 DUF1569 domain-containing protein [Bacteroidota bacterium]